VQVLWPVARAGEVLAPDDSEAALAELYAYPDEGCWVRANMVSTLDGAATGADGRSGTVNTPADHRVFHVLRGLADVVLVGAGTVRAERYGLPQAHPGLADLRAKQDQRPVAVLAVVTRSGNIPGDLGLLDGAPSAIVVTTELAGRDTLAGLRDAVGCDAVIVAGERSVDLNVAVDALQDMGLDRVLCEGGPSLLADLVASGELDELCLTSSPLVIGGPAHRILAGASVERRFGLAHLLVSDGTLLARWVVR
jgi:riboflavin biosynthesis pyrimidine reductase